jgi:hypothetical protein
VAGSAGALGPDHLEGARLLEQRVLGEVDLAHPAGAQPLFQLVLAQLAGFERFPTEHLDAVGAVDGDRDRDGEEYGHGEDDVQQDHRWSRGRQAGHQAQRHGRQGGDAHHRGAAAPGARDQGGIADDAQNVGQTPRTRQVVQKVPVFLVRPGQSAEVSQHVLDEEVAGEVPAHGRQSQANGADFQRP